MGVLAESEAGTVHMVIHGWTKTTRIRTLIRSGLETIDRLWVPNYRCASIDTIGAVRNEADRPHLNSLRFVVNPGAVAQ